MSLEAIRYVLSMDVAKSTDKFVLFCIANYADERGFAYPSIERLVRDTSQNRKTVMKSVASLIESGLLADTGKRVGSTGRVPIYEIVGLPSDYKSHYTYRVTRPDTGEFYIGKRSYAGEPEADSYRGSGQWTRKVLAEGVLLHREVLAVYPTNVEAAAAEQVAIREAGDDPLCRNLCTPQISKGRMARWDRKVETVPKTVQSQFSPAIVPDIPPNSPKNGTHNRSLTITDPKASKSMAGLVRPGDEKYSDSFERFWQAFPKNRKGSKWEASCIWERRNYERYTEEIVQDLENRAKSRKWIDGYNPEAKTYLNKHVWTEPVDETTGSQGHAKETPFERTQRLQQESREDLIHRARDAGWDF